MLEPVSRLLLDFSGATSGATLKYVKKIPYLVNVDVGRIFRYYIYWAFSIFNSFGYDHFSIIVSDILNAPFRALLGRHLPSLLDLF